MTDILGYVLVPLALAAVGVVLVYGLWNMMKGGNPNRSQKLMQMRVLLQLVAIVVIMFTVWFAARP